MDSKILFPTLEAGFFILDIGKQSTLETPLELGRILSRSRHLTNSG